MFSQNLNQPQTVIDMEQLSRGFYFLKIKSSGSEKTIKIIKE
ncbi:T9SS type A sorting domain-containing protein [Flavobacterium sp. CYK-55]|nr:T9SS type A sorting domain-containing protein [Flavobacterium sp. CYK-55]